MAAELLNITPAYVRRMINEGKIKAIKMGHDWLLDKKDISHFKRVRQKKDTENDNGHTN